VKAVRLLSAVYDDEDLWNSYTF